MLKTSLFLPKSFLPFSAVCAKSHTKKRHNTIIFIIGTIFQKISLCMAGWGNCSKPKRGPLLTAAGPEKALQIYTYCWVLTSTTPRVVMRRVGITGRARKLSVIKGSIPGLMPRL